MAVVTIWGVIIGELQTLHYLLSTFFKETLNKNSYQDYILVKLLILNNQLLWKSLFIIQLVHGFHSHRPRKSGRGEL